jgi:DNA-binding response OmpR family regulator
VRSPSSTTAAASPRATPRGAVLVVEDDDAIRDVLAYHLGLAGYAVTTAADGVEGLRLARTGAPDLLVLDLMLPRMGGLDLLRVLRGESAVPVLVLSARGEVADRIAGLECGADDYVAKPFSVREVLTRVEVVLRRSRARAGAPEAGAAPAPEPGPRAVVIDEAAHEVRRRGDLVTLTPREYALLAFLDRHPHQVFSRDALLNAVWGYDYAGDTRTVDVHVHWLRRKVEDDPAHPCRLVTVRHLGYRYEP